MARKSSHPRRVDLDNNKLHCIRNTRRLRGCRAVRACLDRGSAGVTVQRQRAGELTDGSGVRNGDEESDNEDLQLEHGEVGGVSGQLGC